MNKTALKHIDKIAKKLPQKFFTAAMQPKKISGKDAILAGHKLIDDKPIDPEAVYILKIPVNREVDHKLRMKKIYKRRGKIGIITYLRPFVKKESFGKVQVFIMNNIP
jgi:hypothetical protein